MARRPERIPVVGPSYRTVVSSPTVNRAAGRPRDPVVDEVILRTAIEMLLERGYDELSVERVAAAAGVGKTTIYRRFPTKRDLVVAAVSSVAESIEPPLDTGDTRADLIAFVRATFGAGTHAGLMFAIVGTALVKERQDPALLLLIREQVLRPRVRLAVGILCRGVERGEIRPDADLELTAQSIAGALVARHVGGYGSEDDGLERIIEVALRGIAVR